MSLKTLITASRNFLESAFKNTVCKEFIILCREKSDMLVKITLPKNNEQIFASKYETVLPSKDELKELLT